MTGSCFHLPTLKLNPTTLNWVWSKNTAAAGRIMGTDASATYSMRILKNRLLRLWAWQSWRRWAERLRLIVWLKARQLVSSMFFGVAMKSVSSHATKNAVACFWGGSFTRVVIFKSFFLVCCALQSCFERRDDLVWWSVDDCVPNEAELVKTISKKRTALKHLLLFDWRGPQVFPGAGSRIILNFA